MMISKALKNGIRKGREMGHKLDIAYDFLWDFKRKEIIFLVNKKYLEDYHKKIFSIFPNNEEGEYQRFKIDPGKHESMTVLNAIQSIYWDDTAPNDQIIDCLSSSMNHKMVSFLRSQKTHLEHRLARVLFEALRKIQVEKKLKFHSQYSFRIYSSGYFQAYLNDTVDMGPSSVDNFFVADEYYLQRGANLDELWHGLVVHNTDTLGVYELALWCGVAGLCTLYREDQKKNIF